MPVDGDDKDGEELGDEFFLDASWDDIGDGPLQMR